MNRRAVLPQAPQADQQSNAGLLLDRFLEMQPDPKARESLLKSAFAQSSSVYERAFERWNESLQRISQTVSVANGLAIQGRLVTGLGNASPLEVGISLHHTYGVPWLPGTGLKGLAAHYCATVWGKAHATFLGHGPDANVGDAYKILFGTPNEAGCLVFHDGWWHPEFPGLELDVMTPHHGDYYMRTQATATDFDMPVPVSFLSVRGKFTVAVECLSAKDDEAQAKKWADLGLKLLTEAMANWGFGAKTNAGYGRLAAQGAEDVRHSVMQGRSKRASGTEATVKVTRKRDKVGYDVQEPGFPEGTWTVGEIGTFDIGSEHRVLVHDDVLNQPQYRTCGPQKQHRQKVS